VPQQFIDVDRDKVIKQGVPVSDVYKTIQAFHGWAVINYFNRFGDSGRCTSRPKATIEPGSRMSANFLYGTTRARWLPPFSLTRFESRPGPEFTMRFKRVPAAQITVLLLRVQRRASDGRSGRSFSRKPCLGRWVTTTSHVFSGEEGAAGHTARSGFWILFAVLFS